MRFLRPGVRHGGTVCSIAGFGQAEQRAILQHSGDSVAGLPHHRLDPAGPAIGAIGAGPEAGDARTGCQRQRAVDKPDDIGYRDRFRRPSQTMTALRPAPAVHDPAIAQLNQDRFEELARDLFTFGNGRRRGSGLRRELRRQHGRGADSVFALAG
jgi:hypothetical protein